MKKPAWFMLISLLLTLASPVVLAADDTSQPPDALHNLKFRDLGPAAGGGRVSAVVGVPGDPSIYYVGGAAGGVWKTTDGGLSFKAVFEHEATASIGAIALAPSNPNLVWVGTGEPNIRNDVMDGAGVYFSPDAGKSWQLMGLKDAGQISRVIVDPNDPDTVYVAALGHTWGPNPDRGVYKTTDGGKNWKRVLFVSDHTGAIDLVMSASNPKVMFAAMWQAVRYPWEMVDGGPESGIWRSTDGGDTWKKLTKDLPTGDIGRIALAVAPSDMNRVYALVETKHGEGLLWSSSDMGDDWSKVNSSYNLDVRPFYFSRMLVSPEDADKVYFLSFFMMLSKDGGHTAKYADRGVHVDHHAIWIDPTNPQRIIQGNDGGAYLSLDGAKSWRYLDGMPIEQDYMVSASSRSPYELCAGLQDNSAWCGASNTLADDSVTGNDWYQVTGGDGEYAVFAPSNPDLVYVDSQDGAISSFNVKTKRSIFIMPYLHGPGFVADDTLANAKYRFNWTSPIAVSQSDGNTVYLG
ncbi:MAG: WD40/YVTN/BNR-like repeat-containing protein, partial [Gammaproteobacteria bacterium]